ncbi:hypothetical protein BJY04DRAFT_178237 [Aspergillus karnatakaensis]|uniref:uncharacterized protein n=1 Tax=Aspergillus karnatakaensis TaxID=1810916 RepID=UPI003CCCC4C1
MYNLISQSFKPTPAIRRILPISSYHPSRTLNNNKPQVHSTSKVDDFAVNSAFPDDSGTEPTMTQKRTSIHATRDWEETSATQSEADVKADRDEARKGGSVDEVLGPKEPEMDEM